MAIATSPNLKIISRLLVTVIITTLVSTCMARNILLNYETLYPGESLDVGAYSLKMQDSCNLVLYDHGAAVWTSNTGFKDRKCYVVMQNDGNFVMYDTKNNAVVWYSDSYNGRGHYVLVLQEDRNVVIYGSDIWSTGTYRSSVGGVVHTVVNATVGGGFIESQNATTIVGEISHLNTSAVGKTTVHSNQGRNILLSGRGLEEGQSLDVGAYSLKMQDSCNLVLYDHGAAVWTSNTGFKDRKCRANMQVDGNFVIYDTKDNVVWYSNSYKGRGHYVLVLQEDRNVVIYGSDIWSTGTYRSSVGGVVHKAMNSTVDGGFIESHNATMIVGEISSQNATAVGKSLATPEQSMAIMDLIEERWEELVGEMPLKISYPAIESHEWSIVTGCDPKNTRWSYHNGGSWPVLLWLLTAACIKTGRIQIARKAIDLAESRLQRDCWPEYYDGKLGRYVGKQARKYQTWSIAGYLVAKMLLEDPSHLGMISLEEDKAMKPIMRRSSSWTF